MQIVIDIPNNVFDGICDGDADRLWRALIDYFECCSEKLADACKTVVVLPKGHGRLVDEDDVLNNPDGRYYDLYDLPSYMEHHISTVVEADKEGEHDADISRNNRGRIQEGTRRTCGGHRYEERNPKR